MKRKITFFLCAVLFFVAQSWGQTWNLTPTMTAVLDGNGIMTISTSKAEGEMMPDYLTPPWRSVSNNILSLLIEDGVEYIGYWAFSYCTALTSVTLPNSVSNIGFSAFRHCTSLTSVTVPNSVNSIGGMAFYECFALNSVTIGNSVTTIGNSAFSDCSSLTSIAIPNSVTSIGEAAFAKTALTSVAIPDSVTTMGDFIFSECSKLTSVTIGNSVQSIGKRAFFMTALTSVIIGNSVKTIGDEAFCFCVSLASIAIPNSVTSIGEEAFIQCRSLTSVTIGNSVTTIGNQAFSGCRSLTSITIPNSVTSIGEMAFIDCLNMTSVIIGNAVKTIGNAAFYNCINFSSVTIPKSVTSIGDGVFAYCRGLTDVTVEWDIPLSVNVQAFLFFNVSAATLHVPSGTRFLYEVANVWKDFGAINDGTPSVILDEIQTVGDDGKGTFSLNLTIPSDATLTGSFEIQFPKGMRLDEQLTALSAGFSNSCYLSFTYEENNKWLVEIKSNSLRRSTVTEHTKIMDIAYTVNASLGMGTYEATIKNLDFLLDDRTSIKENSLTVPITVERSGMSIENIGNKSFSACFIDNSLRIESSQAEIITIYSTSGVQLYSTKKNAGTIDIPILFTQSSIYIIKGNISGAIKVMK